MSWTFPTKVCKNQENGEDTLDSIRDSSKEIEMNMSPGGGNFGDQGDHLIGTSYKPTGSFRKVPVDQKYGGDSVNSIRPREVGMKLCSNASQKRESDFVDKNRKQQIQRISPTRNNKHHENLKKPISFIHPMNWKSKKETNKKQEKNFESIPDQIKKRQKIVKGRKKCVSKIV